MTDQDLIEEALKVRKNAYCDYSSFSVGAALIDDQGALHVGCNVENSSYPLGLCAETAAIAAMIAAGGRRIEKIAVAGGLTEAAACTPCGGCRQRIKEFAGKNTRIIAINDDGDWHSFAIDELLPHSFHLDKP